MLGVFLYSGLINVLLSIRMCNIMLMSQMYTIKFIHLFVCLFYTKIIYLSRMAHICAINGLRQEDYHEFQANLCYTANSRPAWGTQREGLMSQIFF